MSYEDLKIENKIVSKSISILIPVYNRLVTDLVMALYSQVESHTDEFEILVIDDKSHETYMKENALISKHSKIEYICLEENIGRSRIRNLLAQKSKYNTLLFLDCDSGLPDDDFILRYLNNKNDVCYGGTIYQKNRPQKSELIHWLYGRRYEALAAKKRAVQPISSFRSNNFLINKSVFEYNKFDEHIREYGHEDSLFADHLSKKGIEIKHIENPVIHLGLEKNKTFIEKTELSLKNLILIKKTNSEFTTRLWTLKEKIEKNKYLSFLLVNIAPVIKITITSYPNVYLLQLYKLCYLLGSK